MACACSNSKCVTCSGIGTSFAGFAYHGSTIEFGEKSLTATGTVLTDKMLMDAYSAGLVYPHKPDYYVISPAYHAIIRDLRDPAEVNPELVDLVEKANTVEEPVAVKVALRDDDPDHLGETMPEFATQGVGDAKVVPEPTCPLCGEELIRRGCIDDGDWGHCKTQMMIFGPGTIRPR